MAPQISYCKNFPDRFFLKPERVNKDWHSLYPRLQVGSEKGYLFIFEMDADFSHNPKDLKDYMRPAKFRVRIWLLEPVVKDGGNVNWPRERIILSKGASIYTRLITWMPIKDPTAGFVCYKQEVLQTINLDQIHFAGYAFQIEMKFAAWKLGFKIKEVPIIFQDRKLGVSKMNKGIVKEGILGVLKLRWNALFKNYRRRVKNTSVTEPVNHFSQKMVVEGK
jgi:dolichol-phosphate mannosyltransferase